jgi:uncharacterized phiE125 gp8 family phage protein
MMRIKITGSASLDDIITVANLKAFLRVDHSDEDTYITALRQVAINYIETITDTRLGDVSAVGYLDSWYPATFPVGPVQSITSITYLSTANTTQTLGASFYYTDINVQPARIRFVSPPDLYDDALARVQINMVVGFPEASIPPPMIQAVRLLVGHLYENRTEEVTGTITTRLKVGIDALVSPFRTLL